MANSAYTDAVKKVYIAYYGRAADPLGLAYWEDQLTDNDGDVAAIMKSFGTSPEAITLFGSLTNTIKVNTLYAQIFGRDADDDGLEYYTAQLTAGTMTAVSIAQNILDGASGSDATIITNKLAVAKAFTAAIDSDVKVPAYAGDAAASFARNMLATVDESTDTESFNINTTIESLVSMAAPAATAAYNSTAANIAVTDAAAFSTAALDAFNAAATLTTTSAATSSTADDATASIAIAETAAVTATAANASSTVATMKIAADVALTNSTKAITAASEGLTNGVIADGSGIDTETVINMLEIVGINVTETPFSHEFGWII